MPSCLVPSEFLQTALASSSNEMWQHTWSFANQGCSVSVAVHSLDWPPTWLPVVCSPCRGQADTMWSRGPWLPQNHIISMDPLPWPKGTSQQRCFYQAGGYSKGLEVTSWGKSRTKLLICRWGQPSLADIHCTGENAWWRWFIDVLNKGHGYSSSCFILNPLKMEWFNSTRFKLF